jgi:hypothetical protein
MISTEASYKVRCAQLDIRVQKSSAQVETHTLSFSLILLMLGAVPRCAASGDRHDVVCEIPSKHAS